MIQVAPGTKVYLACRPVSMRYGFDGLSAKVASVLARDPFSGHLFCFRSKRGDYLKILYWDGSGLCLFAKRLERLTLGRSRQTAAAVAGEAAQAQGRRSSIRLIGCSAMRARTSRR